MFRKLKEYAQKVDKGLMTQEIKAEPYTSMTLSPENNTLENLVKYTEIKDYIKSHIQGITVYVTGGQKILSKKEHGVERNPIIIRTFKSCNPYEYSEIEIDGIYMDEKNCVSMIYDDYIGFFINNSQQIQIGRLSEWEHFIDQWLSNNYFYESGYLCEGNQVFKINEEKECYEIIISDIAQEVTGVVINSIGDELALIIICNDKQILIEYDNYYTLKYKD